jgi:hypothetical protein
MFSVPGFIEIKDLTELQLHMMSTENFALLPR